MNENVEIVFYYFIRKILIKKFYFRDFFFLNIVSIFFLYYYFFFPFYYIFIIHIPFYYIFFSFIIKKNFIGKLCQISHNRNELKTYFHGSSLRRRPHEYIQRACGMIHRASYPMKRYQLVQIFGPPFGRVGRQSHPGNKMQKISYSNKSFNFHFQSF